MEAMGARFSRIVSKYNTNNINIQPNLPNIPISSRQGQNLNLYYCDTFGFEKYVFFNPEIMEFSIKLINSFYAIFKPTDNPNKGGYARNLKDAIRKSPIGMASVYVENTHFIPFKNITNTHVQFNYGIPVNKKVIPTEMVDIQSLLEEQNIDSEKWIFGLMVRKLFSIRMVNKMFKENSTEFNCDFLLNFGNIIKYQAWIKEGFEEMAVALRDDKYYILALDNQCSSGVPVAFYFEKGRLKVVINNNQVLLFSKFKKKMLNKDLMGQKITKMMDWQHKYRLILSNDQGNAYFDDKLFNPWYYYNLNVMNQSMDYIINGKFIGMYVIIQWNAKFFPIYVLNQNYVRFNYDIVNISTIIKFIKNSLYNEGNYLVNEKFQVKNYIDLFFRYDFNVHHIHRDRKQERLNRKKQREKQQTNSNNIPSDIQEIVDTAVINLGKNKKNKKFNKNKENNNKNKNNNHEKKENSGKNENQEWTDNGISKIDIQTDEDMGGNGKAEIGTEIKQDQDGKEIDFSQDAQVESQNLIDNLEDNDSTSSLNINEYNSDEYSDNGNEISFGMSRKIFGMDIIDDQEIKEIENILNSNLDEEKDGNKQTNENNNNNNNHQHKSCRNATQHSIEQQIRQPWNKCNHKHKHKNKQNNLNSKSPFTIGKLQFPYLSISDSMADPEYSMFNIASYTEHFSDRPRVWDNATDSRFERDDANFDAIDAVVNLSGKAKINHAKYVKIVIYGRNFNKHNCKLEFDVKLKSMLDQVGYPWNLLKEGAFVTHIFKYSTDEQAQRKLNEKYQKELFKYNKQVYNNENDDNKDDEKDHVWNGKNAKIMNKPKKKEVGKMSYIDKIDDYSGAIFYVQDPLKNDYNLYHCKNGKIDFSKNVRNCNSIEILLDPDSEIFQIPNWDKLLLDEFDKWQNDRYSKIINLRYEFDKDVTMDIIKPSKPATYYLNFPPEFFGDSGGDQFQLREKIITELGSINYRNRHNLSFVPIDLDQLYMVARTRKTRNNDHAEKNWNRWRKSTIGKTYEQMNEDDKQHYRDIHYHDWIYTNTIMLKFTNEQIGIPPVLDMGLYKVKVTKREDSQNDIEKRINQFHQCWICLATECGLHGCKEYEGLLIAYQDMGYTPAQAQKMIKAGCYNCGQAGGHGLDVCPYPQKCKFCGSTSHDNMRTWECPYWVHYAILTYIFEPYWRKNKKIKNRFVEITEYFNKKWIGNLNWEFKPTVADQMNKTRRDHCEKITRHVDNIKYFLSMGDLFAIEENKEMNDFVENAARGQTRFDIGKDYFKIYNYKSKHKEIDISKANDLILNKLSLGVKS